MDSSETEEWQFDCLCKRGCHRFIRQEYSLKLMVIIMLADDVEGLPDIKEMVSIRKDKFDSVRNEFGTQVKRIYTDGEAAKKLNDNFYSAKLIDTGDSYLIDVSRVVK